MKVRLAVDGPEISKIVAGVMTWGDWGAEMNTSQIQSQIESCISLGVTTFDHADIYGGYTTERDWGAAWKEMTIPREEIQVISKCGIKYPCDERDYNLKSYQTTDAYITWSVETSLKKLHVDYLDVLLIHRPSPLMHPEVMANCFEKLKSSGKVKHFGVSNFTASQFDMLHAYFPLVTNQIEVSVLERSAMLNGQLDQCLQHKIKPMAWSPLGGAKMFQESKEYDFVMMRSRLQEVAQKYGWALDELALIFLLHHPAGILPVLGTTKIERLKKAVNALDKQISDEQWFEIWTAATGEQVP